MKAFLIAAATAIAVAAPLGSVYAQAPSNSPSTTMDKGSGHTGQDLKATHADPGTAGSGGMTQGTTTSGSASGATGAAAPAATDTAGPTKDTKGAETGSGSPTRAAGSSKSQD